MRDLMRSAQLLVTDLASTLLFLAVLLATKDLMLAVALGVGLGILQIGWFMVRRKPIDTMQWLSIGLASLIFGVCHWINREYALAAGIVGIYLGAVFYYSENLLAPITTHAIYDFIAMWYLVILKGRQREWPGMGA